jgi:hypothetical protein
MANTKVIYSKAVASIREFYYGGILKYSHINSSGYWEYTIFDNEGDVLYSTPFSKINRLW